MKFGLPSSIQNMNKALAYQVAKTIPKEQFVEQLVDTWLTLFSQSTGSLDAESELSSMRKRIKKSGYQKAFDNAGITDEDLVQSFHEAVRRSGRGLK